MPFYIALLLALASPTHSAGRQDKALEAALNLVRDELKDGETAKFKDVHVISKGNYCGQVNAKNSYGGYTGFGVFFVYGQRVILIPPEQSTPELCQAH